MTEAMATENKPGETVMSAKPQKEHNWLHRLIGGWDFEGECIMDPADPPTKSLGESSVRSLDGLWIQCDGTGDAPDGMPVNSLMTLGFDLQKNRFVGSFVAGCMTHLWVYEGTLDETGNVLTLDTQGPGFSEDGALVPYQDVIEIESKDHWTLKSRTLGDDGQWVQFMTAHYRRKA